MLVQSFEGYVDEYPLPHYTHTEDQAFVQYTKAAADGARMKRGIGLSKKERGQVENKFFKAWLNKTILTPDHLSDNHVSAEIMPVPIASVVIVTPVNDNAMRIFFISKIF